MGRPKLPKGAAKGRIVPVRFTAEDIKTIESKAKAENKSVSEWVREHVHNALVFAKSAQPLREKSQQLLKEAREHLEAAGILATK